METNTFFFIGLMLIVFGMTVRYLTRPSKKIMRISLPANVIPISRGRRIRAIRAGRQLQEANWTRNQTGITTQ